MMLAFVVRQCAVELGHDPNANELAEWANYRRGARGFYRIFGREISAREAEVILRHPQRLVAISPEWQARTPAPAEANGNGPRGQVVSLRFDRARPIGSRR